MEQINFLKNRTFRVVLPSESSLPHIAVSRYFNNQVIYSGIVFELLNALAAYFKFSYELVPPVDDHYGDFVNNSWNGFVGMAQRKEVDMIVAPLTITYPRSTAIDFSAPYFSESIGIMIQLPKKSITLWKMIFVFAHNVWWSVLAANVGVVLIIRLLYWLDVARPDVSVTTTFKDCLWMVYGAVLNQLCLIEAKTWSNRIFQLFWRVSVVLLTVTYAGCLVAALSTERMVLPFQDIKGLAKAVDRNEYKFCVTNGTAIYRSIMNDNSLEYQILRNWLLNHKEFAGTFFDDCTDKLIQLENVAILNEIEYLKTIQIQHCSDVPTVLLEERIFPGYLAFGFPKSSNINSPISQLIIESIESGLVERWKRDFTVKPKSCKPIDSSETITVAPSKMLSLVDLGGSFVLFAIGICLSFLGIFIENYKRVFCKVIK